MRKCMAVAVLLFLGMATVGWTTVPMTSSDGKIRLSGFDAEGYELWRNRHNGRSYFTEYRWWGFDDGDYVIQAAFWYVEDTGGRWSRDLIHTSGFIGDFGALEDVRRSEVTAGPTVETALGDIETLMFDVSNQTYGEQIRQCIGFRVWWDRYRDSYAKILDFYACGKHGGLMTEDEFVEILRGLEIEDEFEALVES